MNHPGGARFEASPAETDSLLQTLLWVCSRNGVQKSAASFLAGLPSTDRLSVEHGIRAMQAAGFAVKVAKRDPGSLPPELLPAVLLNRDGTAYVLLNTVKRAQGIRYEVYEAGPAGKTQFLNDDELKARYGGHCLLIKQLPKQGSAEDDETTKEAKVGSAWLWKVVWRYRRYYYDSIIAAVLINVLSTLAGLFAIHVYDRVIPLQAYSTLSALVAGVTIAILFEAATRQIRDYLMDLAARKADITLSSALFRQALGLRL